MNQDINIKKARTNCFRQDVYKRQGFPITDVDEIEGYESCKQDKSPEEEAEKLRLRERMQAVIREAETMEEGERRAFFPVSYTHLRAFPPSDTP